MCRKLDRKKGFNISQSRSGCRTQAYTKLGEKKAVTESGRTGNGDWRLCEQGFIPVREATHTVCQVSLWSHCAGDMSNVHEKKAIFHFVHFTWLLKIVHCLMFFFFVLPLCRSSKVSA